MSKISVYDIHEEEDAVEMKPRTRAKKPVKPKGVASDDVDKMLADEREAKVREFIKLSISELHAKHIEELKQKERELEEQRIQAAIELKRLAEQKLIDEKKLKDAHKKQISNIKMATMW